MQGGEGMCSASDCFGEVRVGHYNANLGWEKEGNAQELIKWDLKAHSKDCLRMLIVTALVC